MKKWVILSIFLLLAACSSVKTVETTQEIQTPEQTQPAISTTNASNYKPEFKVINTYAKRSPPIINGTVKNTGTDTGDVKLIARVYYAGVVSNEKTQVVQNIKPEEQADFGFTMDSTAQWTSYSVTAENS